MTIIRLSTNVVLALFLCGCASSSLPNKTSKPHYEKWKMVEYPVVMLHRYKDAANATWFIEGRPYSELEASKYLRNLHANTGVSKIIFKASDEVCVSEIIPSLHVMREAGIREVTFLGQIEGALIAPIDLSDINIPDSLHTATNSAPVSSPYK